MDSHNMIDGGILRGPDGRTIKDITDNLNSTDYSIEEQAKILGLKPGDICTFLYSIVCGSRRNRYLYNGTTFEKLPNDDE